MKEKSNENLIWLQEELEMEGSCSGKERTHTHRERERERCCLFGLVLRNDVATALVLRDEQCAGNWKTE